MDILDELIADHRRLYSLLNLFEDELLAYAADEVVDLPLMQDIPIYYAEYFNRYHHPLEDCLFERLIDYGPQQQSSVDNAIGQHDGLKRATARLLTALDRALRDTVVIRAELVKSGRLFLRQNREHVRHEELRPFAQARQSLTIDATAQALRQRIDMDSGRRHYDITLASLQMETARPEMDLADYEQAQGALWH